MPNDLLKAALGVLFALSVGSGCAEAGVIGGKPIAQFPSRPELEAVAAKPATPTAPFESRTVDNWVLQVEAPDPGSAYPNELPGDTQLLQAAHTKPGLTPSPELRCAARETARFYAENGAYPETALRDFMLARCGSLLPSARLWSLALAVDDAQPEPSVIATLRERVAELIESAGSQPLLVGLGFARGHGRANFVLYGGTPKLAIDEFLPSVEGAAQFSVRGRLLSEQASAMALVTQGRFGVARCEPDRRLEFPRFGFTCPMLAKDEQAVVQIVTRRPEHLLEEVVFRAMVRRSAKAGLHFDSGFDVLVQAAGSAAGAAPSFEDSLLGALNRVRHAARLGPVAIEAAQSKFNARLAPQLFEASYANDDVRSDLVALGVLAGWDVAGMIRRGGIYAGAENTFEGARWLALALQDPLGRYSMLDPDISRIAIGTVSQPHNGVLALVSTYAVFDSDDHSEEEAEIFEELSKQREAHGLPPPLRRTRGADLTEALQRVAKGELTSGEALQEALNTVGDATHLHLQGVVVETSDIALVPVRPEFLTSDKLELELGVAHYKPRGGAWGQYVVLYLFVSGPPKKGLSAQRDEPSQTPLAPPPLGLDARTSAR